MMPFQFDMRRGMMVAATVAAGLVSEPARAKILYQPASQKDLVALEPLEALTVIRRAIDAKRDAGRPCGTAALPNSPVASYNLCAQKLAIRCPDGSEHDFSFANLGVAVGQDDAGCGLFDSWCTSEREDPHVIAWASMSRSFTLYMGREEAKSVANAFWSLTQRKKLNSLNDDSAFQSHLERLTGAPDRSEQRRRVQVKAEALISANRLTEAGRIYSQELASFPDWADGHYNLALVYAQLELVPEAIVEMRRFLYLKSDAEDARAVQDQIYAWEALLSQ